MISASTKEFPPFRLDTANECLWCHRNDEEEERILLTPKAFAVLRYLVEHAGRLVTQDEIVEAVWPRVYVQPEVLKHHVLAIRRVLGDDPKHPRFIETMPRRGYRFMATVLDAPASAGGAVRLLPSDLLNRDAQLDELASCLDRLVDAANTLHTFLRAALAPESLAPR
jgi:DNA-binding winged helix-turn-helix (wHTH) protein